MSEQDSAAELEVDSIHTYYGQSHILQGLSLEIGSGEVVALLGRNGAGKTTTIRSIMGLTPPRRGHVILNGQDITGLPANEIAERGIAIVPESRRLFTELSVEENLRIFEQEGAEWDVERVYDIFPRLEERASNRGDRLSGGEQQMCAIARALVTNPDVLLLDEPSEGLAPIIVDDLLDLVKQITESGISVLLAEQNFEFTASLADRNYLLNKGMIRWEGTTEELHDESELLERHLSIFQ